MLQLGLLDVIAFIIISYKGSYKIRTYGPYLLQVPRSSKFNAKALWLLKDNGFAPGHLEIKTFKHILDALLSL